MHDMFEAITILLIAELKDILLQVESFPDVTRESRVLFVSSTTGTAPNSIAAILARYEGFEEDTIALLQRLGLTYLLELGLVRSVVRVAKGQRPNVSSEDLVRCLNYFLENDAFLDFSQD